jgi:uncharacterized protein DUF4384
MLTQLGTLALALLPAHITRPATTVYRPRVEVWTNRGEAAVYTRGDGVRVYFRVGQDAYVTLFRVDTDGRVRVLFPREPWEDNFVRGDREFEAEGGLGRDAFYIDDYPGVGYVFAVAAADPFVYDPISSGDHWDYRVIADGRVRGDPYVALTDLAERIVPEGYTDWDYDIVSYGVERHYDYPRFLCYDCHAYASYPLWNPYSYSCVRFRIVVFDDPWYYPYRYYGGTRVVFVRPFRPEPRFIFKSWGNESRDRFVTRERQRPVNDDTRRGIRGRDLGGVGAIPAPRETGGRRERPANDGGRDRPQADPSRGEPRREAPQAGPRRDPPRAEPRRDPPQRAEPRRDSPRDGGREWTPPRTEPRRDPPPRAEPRRESPPARAEPRRESPPPRAEPRRESPPPRAEPRRESPPPRAEPRRESPPRRSEPKREPELRRRKPS